MPTGPHLFLTYDYVPDIVERRAPHREQHLEHIRAWQESGRLHLAGAVGDPPHGAAFVLSADADAAGFAGNDPYVRNELVTDWRVEPINLVVG